MIVQATLDHLRYVCVHMDPLERQEREAIYDNFDPFDHAEFLDALGTGFVCLRAGGEPVYAGGLTWVRDGVQAAWMVHTRQWRRCVREVTEATDKVLEEMLANGTHRIQCVSLASCHAAHRWCERLGFEREAQMRGWGRNGEDFILFARFRPEA